MQQLVLPSLQQSTIYSCCSASFHGNQRAGFSVNLIKCTREHKWGGLDSLTCIFLPSNLVCGH